MADRTSATVFSLVFNKLASDPTDQHKQWAREIWPETYKFDFSAYQMYCDDALLMLGLARRVNTDDGPRIVYEGDE